MCKVDGYCVAIESVLVLLLTGELSLLCFGLLLRSVRRVFRSVRTIAVDGLTLCRRHGSRVGRFGARYSLLLLKLSHLRGELLLTDSIGLVTLGKKPLLSLETRNLLSIG
jgi:hypothetical protein